MERLKLKANKMAANTHTLRAREERDTHIQLDVHETISRSIVSLATGHIKALQYLTFVDMVYHMLISLSYILHIHISTSKYSDTNRP